MLYVLTIRITVCEYVCCVLYNNLVKCKKGLTNIIRCVKSAEYKICVRCANNGWHLVENVYWIVVENVLKKVYKMYKMYWQMLK